MAEPTPMWRILRIDPGLMGPHDRQFPCPKCGRVWNDHNAALDDCLYILADAPPPLDGGGACYGEESA